jgi:hypothetical protein
MAKIRDYSPGIAAELVIGLYAWLALVVAILVISSFASGYARGDDDLDRARAKAASLIESHKPKAEKPPEIEVFTDADKAEAKAAAGKVPVVLWIGMKPSDNPELRDRFPDCVHCALKRTGRGDVPRVGFIGTDNREYVWSQADAAKDPVDVSVKFRTYYNRFGKRPVKAGLKEGTSSEDISIGDVVYQRPPRPKAAQVVRSVPAPAYQPLYAPLFGDACQPGGV